MQISYNNGKLIVSTDLPGSRRLFWNILTDTQIWYRWGPSVKKVQCNDRFIQSDSTGRVQTAIGLWLPFRISSYKEMDFWDWEVLGIKATGHSIQNLEDGATRISFSMPWWSAPYLIVCIMALKRIEKLAMAKEYCQ